MHFLFNKKTFLGLVGLLLIVGLAAYSGKVNLVAAEGGNTALSIATTDTVFFGANATWKYDVTGSALATGWNAPGFNDSAWASGSAPLGFGNGNERTVIGYGPDSSHKYPTTYFRKTFTIDNPATVVSLAMDLTYDDGAVVYLNGKEINRSNMTSGTISYSTYSNNCVNVASPVTIAIDPRNLVAGSNTLAVEVHQCSANSSDLTFGLALHGAVSDTTVQPTVAPTIAPTTAPTAVPTTAPTAAPTAAPTTAPTIAPTTASGVETVIFGANASWKYNVTGSALAAEWITPGFDDSAWASGSAPLGFGNGDERTTIGYGSDANNKYPTTYFRKTFTIDSPANVASLAMDLTYDDGAVVYLNGKEINRSNMTSGAISYSTYSNNCVMVASPVTIAIDPRNLVAGSNTLAVEVHQCSANSSDLTFGLALHGAIAGTAVQPTAAPTIAPTAAPTAGPTVAPTTAPTAVPTIAPTVAPTAVPTLPSTNGNSYYVTTNGSSSGDGSASRPWNLQTAFSQPSVLRGGDTIWVRGGTYTGPFTSKLQGASTSAPVTLRAYPGERVILTVSGNNPVIDIYANAYVNYWGLEVTGQFSTRDSASNPSTYGIRVNQGVASHDVKFINMYVHDVQAMGFGWWQALTNSEIYGSLIYFNGSTKLDHGIYVHNVSGTKLIANNMIFDNASHGVHGYAETADKGLTNIQVDGNTVFNNGSLLSNYKRNILVGGLTTTYNPVITNNYTYYPGTSGDALNLGYSAGSSGAKVTNNYFAGGAVNVSGGASSLTFSSNYIYAPGGLSGASSSGNTVTSSKPGGVNFFVRPNKYENNRANVTIYNWAGQNTVSIPASSLAGIAIAPGQRYELHNAQNYFGDVVTGTYDGSAIVVPMTNHSVGQPTAASKPPSTFPQFGAFILVVK